jgi:N-acyl amino acid synthase of PEP-CTERM/exosortase system
MAARRIAPECVSAERALLVDRLQHGSQSATSSEALPSWDDGLLGHHGRFFSTIWADTPELLEAAHALRYQVYCLERGFENAAEHPDGFEKDAYDAQSIHGVLFHRPTRRPIGTVRAVLPKVSQSLPVAKLLQANSLNLSDYLTLSETFEISRFAISKEFRRPRPDQAGAALLAAENTDQGVNLPFLSLLQFLLRESIRRNVRFWTAMMEPKLLRMLARMGLCYSPIGPLVEHHGIRQPCYCYLPDLLENARSANPQCWDVLTEGGLLHNQLAGSIQQLAVA